MIMQKISILRSPETYFCMSNDVLYHSGDITIRSILHQFWLCSKTALLISFLIIMLPTLIKQFSHQQDRMEIKKRNHEFSLSS